MTDSATILIVEDDEAIATGLALNLKLEGYSSTVVHDGEAALRAVDDEPPDLIMLDLNLPGRDGLQVLDELRARRGSRIPVIVVSARTDEYDKVAALRLGADDYITKPFALAEVVARIVAVLRRARDSRAATSTLSFGDIQIDLDTRTTTRAGGEVKLTHLEFELLAFLAKHPARVFSREQLLRDVWGQVSGSTRTIDNFVGQLRTKLELDPDNPRHFVTVRGTGYRFDP